MQKIKKINTLLRIWMPLILWMMCIFAFSNRPTIQASIFDPIDFIIKKTAHLTEYAILLVLLFRAIYFHFKKKLSLDILENIAVVFSMIYAVTDEYHQSFISGRTATVRDVFIDFIGILIGISIIKAVKNGKRLQKIKLLVYGR